jgi:hypothetical protein
MQYAREDQFEFVHCEKSYGSTNAPHHYERLDLVEIEDRRVGEERFRRAKETDQALSSMSKNKQYQAP